jgi:hypothetical protein
MEINNGTYPAKLKDYGFRTTKQGDPMLVLVFNVEVAPGEFHVLDWTGTFNIEKAKEFTLKALTTCGFDFNHPQAMTRWADLAMGTMSQVLDIEKTLSIVVENKPFEDRMIPTIKWINSGNSGRFNNLLKPEQVQVMFTGIDVLGAGRALQAKRPVEHQAPMPAAAAPAPRWVTPDTEMPF